MILSLDQAEHCGWALWSDGGKLKSYGCYELQGKNFIYKTLDLKKFLNLQCKKNKISTVVFEGIFFSSKKSYDALCTYNSAIKIYCIENNKNFLELKPSVWRSLLEITKGKSIAEKYVKDNFNIDVSRNDVSDAICIGTAFFINRNKAT